MDYRTKNLQARVTPEEFDAVALAANDLGISVSEWLRGVARKAAGLATIDEHTERLK